LVKVKNPKAPAVKRGAEKGHDLRGLFGFEETRADIGERYESSQVVTHSFGYQLARGIGAVPICSSQCRVGRVE
jgi:hypothetical protein